MVLYTSTTPSTRRDRPNRTATSIRCPRAKFARQATIDAFEWRYAKALDQADFVDRPPRKTVRLLGVSSALRFLVGSS